MPRAKKLSPRETSQNLLTCSVDDGFIILDENNKIVGTNLVANSIFKKEIGNKKVIGEKITDVIKSREIALALKATQKNVCPVETEIGVQTGHTYKVGLAEVGGRGKTSKGKILVLHDVSKEKELERLERDIVSITAHELRTPLASTKWNLEYLLPRIKKGLKKDQKEMIEQVYLSNKRLLVLVNDLLDLSAMEEGKFNMNPYSISIPKITNQILGELKLKIKEKKLKVGCSACKNTKLPKVKADPDRIAQVIMNLLSNAVKYTPEGKKIIIDIKKEAPTKFSKNLNIIEKNKAKKVKEYIVFSVADEGIGMGENEQKKLFSKFFRADNVMNSEIEGTGLGLFITKQIVTLHNGFIWFTSKLNKGSTFSCAIPLT